MIKSKVDLFGYLVDLKYTLYSQAQDTSDLGNPEAAEELKALADHVSTITKRLAKEWRESA